MSSSTFHRLSRNVLPSHYSLTIDSDFGKWIFKGKVEITLQVKEAVNVLEIHSKELQIGSLLLKDSSDCQLKIASSSLNDKDELLQIQLQLPLASGKYSLHIEYSGCINDGLNGFYKTHGKNGTGAVTFMVPSNARKVLPCFDEPSFKSTFKLTFIGPANLVHLSNTREVSSKIIDKTRKITEFEETPIMSSYLLAFLAVDLDVVEGVTESSQQVRVFTPPGKSEQGRFALDVGIKALAYFTQYFGIPFPLSKMDMVAISDFAFGAMENWGLVTYRETRLLIDPENSSTSSRQAVALTVSHEIAHQWFGNLVTMEWWTHLWLNEGFASFVEYLCVDRLFPSFNIWIQFASQVFTRALELDALHNSHAIEVPIGHPSEIDEIFDAISYSKGASVIRMLHRYLGDDDFRKGMEAYLKKHKYQNTQTEDLWDALEEASKKPVRNVMSTWTKQKGFPVISVSEKQSGNNRVLTLTQEKFCADGRLPDSEKDTLWMAPVTFISSKDPSKTIHETLLSSAKSEIVLEDVSAGDWVKLNKDTVGVYRVQYSPEMLQQLLPAIESKTLPPLDRLGLQNDLFALVQAGRSNTVDVLKLMAAFKNEDNYAVWSSINSCLGKLNVLLSHTEFQESLHVFGRRLLAGIHEKLGWEAKPGEPHMDGLLRSLVIARLASFKDEQVLQTANKLFNGHVSGTKAIPADIRAAVYVAVAQNADEKTFNTLLKIYRESELQEEKDRIYRALGLVQQPELIIQLLDFAMSKEVRNSDAAFIVASVATSKLGREQAWRFFKTNVTEFLERYKGGPILSRLVKDLTENFASEEEADEIKKFFDANSFPGAERAVQQSLETVRSNTNWLQRDRNDVKIFLEQL